MSGVLLKQCGKRSVSEYVQKVTFYLHFIKGKSSLALIHTSRASHSIILQPNSPQSFRPMSKMLTLEAC